MSDENDRIGQLGKRLDAQYAKAAREIRRFRVSRTKTQPVVVEVSPTVLGEWGSLVESVGVLAATSAGVPGAAEASKVIKALCGIQDAQAAMLTCIRRDVQLLRTAPFRAAQEHLVTAL